MVLFTVADRYEVLEPLGMGGMGSVYLARDLKFGVEVALKTASASGLAYAEFKQRFLREARISYVLGKAEGVVRVLDWGELEPGVTLYLVMDLVPDARPLDLHTGPLEERLALLVRCARIVERIHARGVVHRDLKPANFLLGAEDTLLLSDFGVAKVLDPDAGIPEPPGLEQGTQTGANLGTPLYMAPEQFKSSKDVDQRTDVYSLGVLLFHCLTSRYPFEGDSPLEVMSAQLDLLYGKLSAPRPADLQPDVSEALDLLCADAIQLDPSRRPPSAGAFADRLEQAIRRAPTRLSADPAPPPRQRLRVDVHGFVSAASLRRTRATLGEESFLELIAGSLALRVRHERPLDGRAEFQDKFAFLLPRRPGGAHVTLGRTDDNDLCLPLPTISQCQLIFTPMGSGWLVSEQGSRNGTLLNEVRLTPQQPQRVRGGDLLHLSKHVVLEVLEPQDLTI